MYLNSFTEINCPFLRYGKNKDAFGWPDENEDAVSPCQSSAVVAQGDQDRGNEEINIEKLVLIVELYLFIFRAFT